MPRYRLAQLLELPSGGRTELRIGGPAADEWLQHLGKRVAKPAHDADFAVDGSHVRVIPAKPGSQK